MVRILIKAPHQDQGEAPKTLEVKSGELLMDSLRDAGFVEGTCGGVASCGTCHVYFEDVKLAGTRTEDEGYMLEGLEDFVKIRDGSRLSCQVKINDSHNEMTLEIAPDP